MDEASPVLTWNSSLSKDSDNIKYKLLTSRSCIACTADTESNVESQPWAAAVTSASSPRRQESVGENLAPLGDPTNNGLLTDNSEALSLPVQRNTGFR